MHQNEFTKLAKKSDNNIANIIQTYRTNPDDININAKDGNSKTLMHHAAVSGNINLLAWLVLENGNINSQTNNHSTPLHFAVAKKKLEAAAFLIMLGADVSIEKTTKKNKEVFSPTGYTTNAELNACIRTLKKLHQELSDVKNNPTDYTLNDLPQIKEYAPIFLKKLTDINGINRKQNLDAFFQRYPIMSTINQLIQNDADAKQRFDNTVVHNRENTEAIRTNRDSSEIKHTPSLQLSPEKKAIVKSDAEARAKILILEDEITHHQHLRLQLAFYLFIAYYKTRIDLTIRNTDEQEGHGSGKKGTVGATAACHTALLKGVIEQFRWKDGVRPENEIRSTRANSETHEQQLKANNYFYHLIAATTNELPEAVNWYDGRLEGKTTIEGSAEATRELFKLLQNVSLGYINPIQALETFTIALIKPDGILEHVKNKADFRKELKSAPSSVKELIHQYTVEATKQTLKENDGDGSYSFKRCHIANLLFMDKRARKRIENCSDKTLETLCEPYFMDLQSEIKSHHL